MLPNLRLMTEFTVSVFHSWPYTPSRRAWATKSVLALREGSSRLPPLRTGGIRSPLNGLPIKTCVGYHHPGSSLSRVLPIASDISAQAWQRRSIAPQIPTGSPGQDKPRFGTNRIGPIYLVLVEPSTTGLVVKIGLSRRKTGAVRSNVLFFDPMFIQQLILHLLKIQYAQLSISALQGRMVWNTRQSQLLTDCIRCQQLLFHVSVARIQIKPQQHTGYQLW